MNLIEGIESWNKKKVLIIGEALLDKYITGQADRISPDAPVPNIKIEGNSTYLGGIGLVLRFIKSLGGIPKICTIIGNDYEGEFFLKKLKELSIETSGILIDDTISTPQITRIKAMNQHILRLETDYNQNIPNSTLNKFIEKIISTESDLDSILILDYGIGGLFQDIFINNLIIKLKQNFSVPIIARPNINNYYLYEDIDMIRLHLKNALNALSIECCNDTSVSIVGKKIINTTKTKSVLLNHIESKSYLFENKKENFEIVPSSLNTPVRSYVTVGSIIMAILGLTYANKFPPLKAAELAIKAACFSASLPPIEFFNQEKLINNISKE
ncbi:MAG: hypothetical protein KGD63_09740 [Candidatus Lokiarchaeota archaeon]|nr:hypothetical protein [Candidatus Lokiarchaeota archaeon]